MDPAWISLGALVVVILASGQERSNVGILALGFSWIIGLYAAEMSLAQVIRLFPWSLFVVLFGVTFFFGLAKNNGALDQITRWMVHAAGGKTVRLPVNFFVLAVLLSMIGPGNMGAIALLAPFAMPLAGKAGISAFFMTIILVAGANAGAFSPFAPTGIIADGLIARLGLGMDPWVHVFYPSLLAHSLVALICYLILVVHLKRTPERLEFDVNQMIGAPRTFTFQQIITLTVIAVLIVGVVVFRLNVGWWSLGLAFFLILIRAANGKAAFKAVPWNIIIMVCGVSTLVGVLENSGGLDLFTSALAKVSDPISVTGMVALLTGVVSSYSSSSGVVMPAFIPIVPELIEKIGGGSPMAIVSSINVGSHLVDVSPLSTLGAICIANAARHENKPELFRRLLIFGLSMSVVGAVICYVFFGLLGKWFVS